MDHKELTSRLRELGFERADSRALAHLERGVARWTHPKAETTMYIFYSFDDEQEEIEVALSYDAGTLELFLDGFEQGLQGG